MKRIISLSAIIIAILFIAGCPLQNFNLDEGMQSSFSLPSDAVSDTARFNGGEFQFETLLPVQLDIHIDLYDPNIESDSVSSLLPTGSVPVVVILEDMNGNNIYTGMSGSDGTFSTIVNLPAAPEDMVLRLLAKGFEEREVVISDMVEKSVINRTMGMTMPLTDGSAGQSRVLTGLEDRDGDGVPDIYDTDPDDPNITFVNTVPAIGQMTVAFEDLFGRAQAGDADYNDFIARYKITETSGTDGFGNDGITNINVSADAVVKLAGYNHRFGIRINSFEGTASLDGKYINAAGNTVTLSDTGLTAPLEIDLFENTRDAVGKSAWFTLSFTEAQQRGVNISGLELDDPPYNPYLHIINTGHDVHLIGEEALTDSINPADSFRDTEGFPWGLLVPTEWIHPEEGKRIETSYPRFTLWRESGGEEHADWYLVDPYEPPVGPDPDYPDMVFASDRDGDMEIYALDMDTGVVTQLTTNGVTDKHPALSADRSKIAFVSEDSNGIWGIYTMNSDGSNVSSTALVTLNSATAGHPSWNPVATMIAYDNFNEIYTMNADGSGTPDNLTNALVPIDIEPAWSPDGNWIAFSSSADGDYDIYTIDPISKVKSVSLTVNTAVDRKPSWSSDSTQIAFSTNRVTDYDIYTMNADGSAQAVLAINAGDETSPSWSADGASIAYVKGGEIYTRNSDGSGGETNLTSNTAIDQDPSW